MPSRHRIATLGLVAVTLGALLVVGQRAWPRAAGSLDATFGKDGIATSNNGTFADFETILVEPDGRILVGGMVNFDFAVARYTPDGMPDSTFGSGGTVTTDIGGMDNVWAMALLPDGRIVAVGQIIVLAASPSRSDFAVARYTPDGKLDASFGKSGVVTTDIGAGDDARAVAVQPDGRILVAGSTGRSGSDLALERYTGDGTPDPSFGKGGIVTTPGFASPSAVVVQPDGGILVAGTGLVRFTPDGKLDPSFGGGGIVRTPMTLYPRAVALHPDGKIVVAGSAVPSASSTARSVTLVRYAPDGTLDPSFGSGGIVSTPETLYPGAVAIEPDGRVVVAGSTRMSGGARALARYSADGMPDPAFGAAGVVTTTVGNDDSVRAVAIQPDGRIVVAGSVHGGCSFFVALCDAGTTSLALSRHVGD